MELFQEVIALCAGLQQEGRIESFEPVLLNPHGGSVNGFIVLRGERAKLQQVTTLDKWAGITLRASFCLESFCVTEGSIGADLQQRMAAWSKLI